MIFLIYAIIGACVPALAVFASAWHLRREWDSMRAHARTRPELRLRWTPRWARAGDRWWCCVEEVEGRGVTAWMPEEAYRKAAHNADAIYPERVKRRGAR